MGPPLQERISMRKLGLLVDAAGFVPVKDHGRINE